jgi:DNA-binding response OmpR family regulator
LLGLRSFSHFETNKRARRPNGYGRRQKPPEIDGIQNRRYTLKVVGGTTTVLVVDDDPSLRLLCRVNLELEGFAVVEAGTIGEAEHALDTGGVDVVLLDLHLGNEQGISLVPALEEHGLGSSVALLTGSPGSRLPAGATVIPKPFAIDELTGTVRRLAES